jgi:protoheme IX farnesyltransferase
VPHFWLLILKYGEEYKKAGIPSLTEIFSSTQINRLTFTWVVSSVVAAIFLCYFGIIQSKLLIGILLAASAFTIWRFSDMIRIPVDRNNYTKYSMALYLYFLVVMILLIFDRLIG